MTFNRKLKNSWQKSNVNNYRARKPYPKKLINEIVHLCKINKESKILDIGCGTGRSTIPFAKKGYQIIGIDISAKMLKEVKTLSRNFPNIECKRVSFENYRAKPKSFDLVIAGTSFHWLNPNIAYKKAGLLLKDNGWLVIFFNFNKYNTHLLRRTKKLFIKYCKDYPSDLKGSKSTMKKRIRETNRFHKVRTIKFQTKETYSKKQFVDLINSFSWIISLDNKNKEDLMTEIKKLLDKNKSPIEICKENVIIAAKKRNNNI